MPIVKIVGIDSREYVKKETGELKNTTIVHYTYSFNEMEKGKTGMGADNVFFDIERNKLPEIDGVYLLEKDKKGYLDYIQSLDAVIKAASAGK
jgi:hypothetical protein